MWKTLKESFETPDSYVSLALGLAVVLVVGMITFNYFKAKMETATSTSEQKTEEAKEATTLPAKYTVVGGDTLWSIAEKYYKSGYNWVDIQKANGLTDPNLIENGQTLTIPDAKPITMPPGVVSSASTVKSLEKKPYTILQGDNLWSIAVKMYGDGYRWTDIAQASSLADPDVIYTGNVLTLPQHVFVATNPLNRKTERPIKIKYMIQTAPMEAFIGADLDNRQFDGKLVSIVG